jgi:hypothetical protein
MTNDELIAAVKVRDMERETEAFLRNRDLLRGKTPDEPHYRPPMDPPLPLSLAKEFRQTL